MQYQLPITQEYPVFLTEEELRNGCKRIVKILRVDSSGQENTLDLHVVIPRGSRSGFSKLFPGCGSYIKDGMYQDALVVAVRNDSAHASDPQQTKGVFKHDVPQTQHTYNPSDGIHNAGPAMVVPQTQHTHNPSDGAHNAGPAMAVQPYNSHNPQSYSPHPPNIHSYMAPSPNGCYSPSQIYSPGYSAAIRKQSPCCFSLQVPNPGEVSLECMNNGDVKIQVRDYLDVLMGFNFHREFTLTDQSTITVRFADFNVIGAFVRRERYFTPRKGSILSGNVEVLFIADVVPKHEWNHKSGKKTWWSCFS